jgi:hypothetical protein
MKKSSALTALLSLIFTLSPQPALAADEFLEGTVPEGNRAEDAGGRHVGPYSFFTILGSGQLTPSYDQGVSVYIATHPYMDLDNRTMKYEMGAGDFPTEITVDRTLHPAHQTDFFIYIKDDRLLRNISVRYKSGVEYHFGFWSQTAYGFPGNTAPEGYDITNTSGGRKYGNNPHGPFLLYVYTNMFPNGDEVSFDLLMNDKVIYTVTYDPSQLTGGHCIINASAHPDNTTYYTALDTTDYFVLNGVYVWQSYPYERWFNKVVKIGDSNYMRIRDAATLLAGTEKQFAVDYDPISRSPSIITGQPYTPTGTELSMIGAPVGAVKNPSAIIVDGTPHTVDMYLIDGSNFVSVRTLFRLIDCSLSYGKTPGQYGDVENRVSIDTTQGYHE